MMKDYAQKQMLGRHLYADGCFVLSEVVITNANSISSREMAVTDIDVLGIRPNKALYWEFIVGDCKTQKNLSAINRAFWIKGIMDSYSASSGFLIIKTDKRNNRKIDLDHRLLANKMGIRILEEDDFISFDKAIIYPYGSDSSRCDLNHINDIKESIRSNENLEGLHNYIFRDFWMEKDRISGIRKILNLVRRSKGEFDPEKANHRDTLTLTCSIFSIALAECVGSVFNQFTHPDSREELDLALKPLLWSGWAHYNTLNQMRRVMLKSSGSAEEEVNEGDLTLPMWNDFINIFRGLLDNPRVAFDIPRLLESLIFDLRQNSLALEDYNKRSDLDALKQSMLIFMYFCRATRLPREFENEIVSILIKRQSEIVQTTSLTPSQTVQTEKTPPAEDDGIPF